MKDKAFWSAFVTEYTKDKSYWYIPKGKTINKQNLKLLRKQLKVLKKYEGKNWVDCQRQYTDEITRKKLVEHRVKGQKSSDYTAISRMVKVIFDLLGLAWVDDKSKVFITSTGAMFLEATDLNSIVRKQLLKYQFYNPSLREKYFKSIRLFPHIFLLELLLAYKDTGITKDEYILFVTRTKSHEQLSEKIEQIRKYRELTARQKNALKIQLDKIKLGGIGGQKRRTSIYNTIFLNHSYSLNFLTYPEYVRSTDFRIILKKSAGEEASKIIQDHKKKAVYVEFASEKDWFSFYGDYNKDSSYLNALEYYEDKTDIYKAIEIFKEAKGRNLIPVTESDEEYIQGRIKEKILEDFLEYNLQRLEGGLILVKRHYPTLVGPIDLLAMDKNKNYVVIELKKGRASDRVFGQISRYVGWVKENLRHQNDIVRGIIVGAQIDRKLVYSVRSLDDPSHYLLKEFQFYFRFLDKTEH